MNDHLISRPLSEIWEDPSTLVFSAAAAAADDDAADDAANAARDKGEEGGADGSVSAPHDPSLAELLSELGFDDGEYADSLAPVRCLGSVAGAFEAAAASVEAALAREEECLMAATTVGGRRAGWNFFCFIINCQPMASTENTNFSVPPRE